MDNKKPEIVSIIVPIYKVEEYLPACIDSICNQTYRYIEIILVDDGSPDRCGVMCDEYAAKDDRIRVIHKENGGLSDARNAGLAVATGAYIVFVDSDDWISEDYVERSLYLATQYQADIVVCDFLETEDKDADVPGAAISDGAADVKVLNHEEAVLAWLYRRYYGATACAKMYSRRSIEGIQFPKGKLHEDVGTTYKMFLQAERTVYYSKKMYFYRMRPGSIVNSKFDVRRFDYLEFTREIMDLMQQKYPQFYAAAVSRHFQGCIQTAVAQNAPSDWLIQEIKKYAPMVLKDGQARMLYRALAFASLFSPTLTIRVAKLLKK